MSDDARKAISEGRARLGIEFGSTRIKAVLIDERGNTLAVGNHDWENRLENNIWTYSEDDIWSGLKDCYSDLLAQVREKYGTGIKTLAAMGFSAMMHGYMAFDENDRLLVPFRTWRNTITREASEELTREFGFHIPQRWSVAHLYQAVLNDEPHVKDISYILTLAGYVHYSLTGEKVLGVGEASGMFPIDSAICDYDAKMLARFGELIKDKNYDWTIDSVLPKVLKAGEGAGTLTQKGAMLLDATGELMPGIPLCPPEGDAGTGMTATNSVAVRTGNVSAGTSVFAMVVLDKPLKAVHEEIDVVTTPEGYDVAMVHCNNCTSDINAWAGLFRDFAEAAGLDMGMGDIYSILFNSALKGNKACDGLMSFNYFSGEHITGLDEGRPLFVRSPKAVLNLPDFMRTQLYTSLGALKTGLDILFKEEKVETDKIYGHGGFFKTPVVGQKILAAAMNTPVTVMETAGEGGAWGIAVLADYMKKKSEGLKSTLSEYLNEQIFNGMEGSQVEPDEDDVRGFDEFMNNYKAALNIERAAVKYMTES